MKGGGAKTCDNSQTSLTVAVISDVHAYDGVLPDNAPSHCCVSDNDPAKNPVLALKELIRKESLKADLLLCPGDLGDRAQPVAIQYVWGQLNEVQRSLKAKRLLATTGNHDVDSRHAHNECDAKGVLQALTPRYPFSSERLNDEYWSRNFVTIAEGDYRVLVLNSSAFHGEGRFSEHQHYEYEHGRVSQHTIRRIEESLGRMSAPNINVLLCHHHPHPHSELRLGDEDLMAGGRELLDLLGSGMHGQWLVIHGHKHHPKLEYAAGGATSPIVFAAGSCAAVLFRELQTHSRNQFYLLQFPRDRVAQFGLVGRFRSWDWVVGDGWIPASSDRLLPAKGGFGWRGNLVDLASRIEQSVTSVTSWENLRVGFPELDFLLPRDLRVLLQRLRNFHNLQVEPQEYFPPVQIGRTV